MQHFSSIVPNLHVLKIVTGPSNAHHKRQEEFFMASACLRTCMERGLHDALTPAEELAFAGLRRFIITDPSYSRGAFVYVNATTGQCLVCVTGEDGVPNGYATADGNFSALLSEMIDRVGGSLAA
jgi:hypothetical protein